MARIRTLKPEFCSSEQVADCSPNARLLFVCMWCFCDDAGIHQDSPKRLKMEVFPSDDFTAADVSAMVDELVVAGLLERYMVRDASYLRVTGWRKHQKIDQPNYRHPSPDGTVPTGKPRRGSENSTNVQQGNGEHSTNHDDERSPNAHRASDERSPPEGNGMERKGIKEKTIPQPPSESALPATPCAETTRREGKNSTMDAIDRIRDRVWRQQGLTPDQIGTKHASTSREGVDRAKGWLGLMPETEVLAEIDRAYQHAEDGGKPIKEPWSYLDAVMASAANRKAGAAKGAANEPHPDAERSTWRARVKGWKTSGWWMDGWGPMPGEPGNKAPADVLAEVLGAVA